MENFDKESLPHARVQRVQGRVAARSKQSLLTSYFAPAVSAVLNVFCMP